MTIQAVIAIAALCIPLFVGLLGVTWRFATLASRLAENSAQLKERIEKFDLALLKLDRIPLLEQRISQIEDIVSTIPKLLERVVVMETRMTKYRERHQSFPGLEEVAR